jgi:hypothetical protein
MLRWILIELGKLLGRKYQNFSQRGYYELKHKPWFGKGCSKLLDQRKQANKLHF